jgi:hypothetical protein
VKRHVPGSTIFFSLVVGTLSSAALGQPAPQPCAPFRAIIHGSLPTSNRLAPNDTWGGPIHAKLGDEAFHGAVSGNDGDVSVNGAIATGRRGSYRVCFPFPDCTDSFTYVVPSAVSPAPDGRVVFGEYTADVAIVTEGTGRFRSASGNLNVRGPFMVWTLDEGKTWLGRWNGEISGTLCGLAPPR